MDAVVPVNYTAIFLAAVASMVIGYIWYGPLFGKQWMKEVGLTKEKIEAGKKDMGKSYGLMFASSLTMAYVLSHVLAFASSYMRITGTSVGISTAFWNWLGFIAPVLLGAVLWEGKSMRLWMIQSGYYLVTLVAMGIILMSFAK